MLASLVGGKTNRGARRWSFGGHAPVQSARAPVGGAFKLRRVAAVSIYGIADSLVVLGDGAELDLLCSVAFAFPVEPDGRSKETPSRDRTRR